MLSSGMKIKQQLFQHPIYWSSHFRFLSLIGSSPWTFTSEESRLKDLELAEWEESILAKSSADNESALNATEELLTREKFGSSEIPTPSEVIIFSRLYEHAATAKLDAFPQFKSWYLRLLALPQFITGIEQAAAQTTVKPVEPSHGKDKSAQATPQKINLDAQAAMHQPSPTEDM